MVTTKSLTLYKHSHPVYDVFKCNILLLYTKQDAPLLAGCTMSHFQSDSPHPENDESTTSLWFWQVASSASTLTP